MEVCVENALAVLEDESLMSSINLVIPVWTMGEISDRQVDGIRGVLERGGGLAGWHGGMGDAFRSNTAFQFMVGGQFVAHPGNVRRYTVEPAAGISDPIIEGIPAFEIESEQYYLHVDPSNEVLLETVFDGSIHPWLAGTRMPVAWKRRWGAGRVFYSSIGHVPEELDIPEVRAVLSRGLVWAAGVASELNPIPENL